MKLTSHHVFEASKHVVDFEQKRRHNNAMQKCKQKQTKFIESLFPLPVLLLVDSSIIVLFSKRSV